MKNRDVYNLIARMSSKKYELMSSVNEIDSQNKRVEYGMYHLFSSFFFNINDENEINEMIIDSDYNKNALGISSADYGVDLVHIDEEKKVISLANFKCTNKFDSNKTLSENDISDCFKFVALMDSEEATIEETTKGNDIIVKLREEEYQFYDFKIYHVSNTVNAYNTSAKIVIDALVEKNSIEVIPVCLKEWNHKINAQNNITNESTLELNEEDVFTFTSSAKSTQTSLVFSIPAIDIINLIISNDKVNYTYLGDNVRGYLGERNKNNKNIIKTIIEKPEKLFYYNNGITVIAKDIEDEPGRRNLIRYKLKDYQIVNGGQSLVSLANYYLDPLTSNDNLKKAKILVRCFEISDNELVSQISEYTNSQTEISNIDLKSVDTVQVNLERYLLEHNINYIRKKGEYNLKDNCDIEIGIETVAQIIYSKKDPKAVTNTRRKLFDEYYDEIFSTEFTDIYSEIIRYIDIQKEYKNSEFKVTKQKMFFIIYILENSDLDSIEQLILDFEKILSSYIEEKNNEGFSKSEAKYLIEKEFFNRINDRYLTT